MGLLSAMFRRKLSPRQLSQWARDHSMGSPSKARELAEGSALPIRPSEPFRQSYVGGTEDLLEAVRMGKISWPEFVALITAGGMGAGMGAAGMQNAPLAEPAGRSSY